MKKNFNYITLLVVAFAFAGCTNDDIDAQSAGDYVGDDVQFGLSFAKSRTIYGPEEVVKNDAQAIISRSYPIYWSENDKVKIYSPDCPAPRNNAEYIVKPVAGQSYAESLTKTDSYGVQWGQNSAKFYSVYPSTNASFQTENNNVTAKMNIGATQKANVLLNIEDNVGVYYVADMNNVIMYAQTDAIAPGDVVNLQYNPFSTVLEFEISATGDGTALVDSLKLEADEPIVGDFTLTFDGDEPTVEPAVNSGNTLKMDFAVKPELNNVNSTDSKVKNSTMRVKMCLMPKSGVKDINNWKLTIFTLEGGEKTTHVKTFSGTSALVPGKIHKVKLPTISANKKWEYKPAVWMTQIPEYQTVYLTEYSIPGAWYAGGKGYQYQTNNNTPQPIADLWNAGVRAFGVECRTCTSGGLSGTPSYVGVSGTGTNNIVVELEHYWNATKLSKIITDIVNKVKNSNEFAVLVLNYAYGARGGYRTQDYQFFLNGVKAAITDSGQGDYIASNINKNTTTADVMNKLIIKINVDSRVSYDASGVNAMFSVAPLAQDLSNDKVYFSDLSYGSWTAGENSYTDNPTITADSYLWCFSSANRTQLDTGTATNIPSYGQRKAQLNAMMEHSKQIYDSSTHNVWFYFNCGGTEATSLTVDTDADNAKAFAGVMNPWLKKIIDLKTYGGTKEVVNEDGSTSSFIVSSDPSPLGIVMFNYCTDETYQGPAIIKAIIEMNNKSGLKHATPKTKGAYDGTVNNGGNAITTK